MFSFHITGYGCAECIRNEDKHGLKADVKYLVNEVRRGDDHRFCRLLLCFFYRRII